MKAKHRRKRNQPHPMHFIYLVLIFIGFYMIATSFGSHNDETELKIIDFETKPGGYNGHLITQKKIQTYAITDKNVNLDPNNIKYVDYLSTVVKVTTMSGEIHYLQKDDISPITATVITKDDKLTTKEEYLRLKHEQESDQFSIFFFLLGCLCLIIVAFVVAIEDSHATKKA